MIHSSNRSEWFITVTVILCSVILLGALAFAIGGNPFRSNQRTVTVLFPDITGIKIHSLVKYAGADAGAVSGIRMLTLEERAELDDPANSVEVTLSLARAVPTLTNGSYASLASDTILADKFVLISPGPADAPPLGDGDRLAGMAPTTIDALSAELSAALGEFRSAIAGFSDGETGDILGRLPELLTQITTTLTQAQTLIKNADTLVGNVVGVVGRADALVTQTSGVIENADTLVSETRPMLSQLLADLKSTAATLDAFANRAEKLIKENEQPINRTTRQLERAVADLRVTSAYAKTLAESLLRRPQQIIWGTRREPNEIPAPEAILRD